MSDCVLLAFGEALTNLGVGAGWMERERDFRNFHQIKARWQRNPTGYTEIALVPHIVRSLAAGYDLAVTIQHRLYTMLGARRLAFNERDWRIWLATYRWPDWGRQVDTLTLPGAIYLSVGSKHAYWRRSPVTQGHLMALQLRLKGEHE